MASFFQNQAQWLIWSAILQDRSEVLALVEDIAADADLQALASYILKALDHEDFLEPPEYQDRVLAATLQREAIMLAYELSEDLGWENVQAWQNLAKIGGWYWWDIYQASRGHWLHTIANTSQAVVAWAWVWGNSTSSETCAYEKYELSSTLKWNAVPVLSKSLLKAIQFGWLKPPEDKEAFLLDYCRWSCQDFALSQNPLDILGLSRKDLSEQVLQGLACFWRVAAEELGFRHILLQLPLAQDKNGWIEGVKDSLDTFSPPEFTFEEAIAFVIGEKNDSI